ncbi:MAG TPA: hypothetical protein VGL86_13165 [Polyangia bacterium]|jgi:hypothetical protein
MKRYLLIASMLGGCMSPIDEFRGAAPSAQTVSITVPDGVATSKPTLGAATPDVLGQRATFYEITRGVTAIINGGVGVTLLVLEAIVAQEPTAVSADHANWGPYTGALAPTTWKFDVQKVGPADFSYTLSGKPRAADDTAYQSVIAGSAHVVSRTVGSGDFMFDFTALHALDGTQKALGSISVHYDNTGSPRVVSVAFKGFDDGNGSYTPDSALYSYAENADRSGNFSFVAKADVDHDPAGLQETLSIKSAWLATGQGDSQVDAGGGSLGVAATLEECWDSGFARSYFTDSWNAADTEGDPASCKP